MPRSSRTPPRGRRLAALAPMYPSSREPGHLLDLTGRPAAPSRTRWLPASPRRCPKSEGHQAERMTGGAAEPPEVLAPAPREVRAPPRQFPRAEPQCRLLGLVEIADAHIKVHLLRMLRVRPSRRPH